jgi:hypothetical protein
LAATSAAIVLVGQMPALVIVAKEMKEPTARVSAQTTSGETTTAPESAPLKPDEGIAAVIGDSDVETGDDGENLSQRLTRRVSAEGADVLEGSTTATFLPGQKQAMVHISFCPPFLRIPELSCEILVGDGARAKLASAHAYGARVEVRLNAPAAATQIVRVGFNAVAAPAKADAA